MKAYICEKYGTAEQLTLRETDIPTPAPDEVLIKVHATSLNSWDWDRVRGHLFTKMESPAKPSHPVPGSDVAGIIADVGSEVAGFGVGDRVFGDLSQSGWGAFAEYATGKAQFMAKMPEGLSFEEAATMPQAGLLALQSVRDEGQVAPGMQVLINGGGGGAGMFAIQLAKFYGAVVTGVDAAEKLEAMRMFGADHVYDYQETDFTRLAQKFDVVIDVVAQSGPSDYFRALAPMGKFIAMGGKSFSLLRLFLASRKRREDGKSIKVLMWACTQEDMVFLAELVRDRKIKVFIERIFAFEQLKAAMVAQSRFQARGKHVVHMQSAETSPHVYTPPLN